MVVARLTEDLHRPGVRRLEAGDEREQCGLPGPRSSRDGDDLTGPTARSTWSSTRSCPPAVGYDLSTARSTMGVAAGSVMLDHPAVLQPHDVVGGVDHGGVMAGQHRGGAPFDELSDGGHEQVPRGGVELRGRLVGQQEERSPMAAAANATRLLLASGQLGGVRRGSVGEPDCVQEIERLGGVHAPQPCRELDLFVGS